MWLAARAGAISVALTAGLVGMGVHSGPAIPVEAAPAVDSAHPAQVDPPDPLTQPLLDGCQRYPLGLFSRTSPEWAYIHNTQSSQPPPAPQWVVGTVSAFNARYQAVHTSGGDLPFGHSAYDYNVNVLPDAQYSYLLGSGQAAKLGNWGGSGEETARLHTEWEDLSIPQFAWAEPGDRITELGSWVWDCGHWGTPTEIANPDYILPKVGQPQAGCLVPTTVGPLIDNTQCTVTGESAEFHPYRVLWDVRARSTGSPYGEAQGELFVSTDKTLAGIESDCAHRNPAVSAVGYPPTYRACLETEPRWQDVTGDYSFLLPAPPRPSPTAHLTARVVDRGSTGAPRPTLRAEGDAVRVTFHLATAPGQTLIMGDTVFAGWAETASTALPTHLHITLDSLAIHRAMDPGCTVNAFGLPTPGCPYTAESTRNNQASLAPANWNLYYDASGVWGKWVEGGNAELQVTDGQVLQGTSVLDLYVPPGQPWRFFVHGRECDLGALGTNTDCPSDRDVADDNDVQGLILDQYASAAAGVGTHHSNAKTHKDDPTSTCPDVNPQGCYTLSYTVSVVHDEAGRAGSIPQAAAGSGIPNTAARTAPTAATWLPFVLTAAVGLVAGRRRSRERPERQGRW